MQTTVTKAGNAPDLLSGILSVQVRNEDKITEQDRLYCQMQQELLYKTLDQIDRWYAVFKEEAEQYQAERKFHYEENGKVSMRDFYTYHNNRDDYSHNEFKPFDLINDLVDKNRNANANFAGLCTFAINKSVPVIIPMFGYIYQPVADLRCDFRACPLDKLHMIVGHIHIFLCQSMFMVV